MFYKCTPCNMSFSTAEEFMNHKISHQIGQEKGSSEKKGLVCLKCGKHIPVDSSRENYRGDMDCVNCGQKMRVALENGEVIFASMRGE